MRVLIALILGQGAQHTNHGNSVRGPFLVIYPRFVNCLSTAADIDPAVIIRVLAIVDQALRSGQLISKR